MLVFLGNPGAQGAGAKDSFFAALPKTDLRHADSPADFGARLHMAHPFASYPIHIHYFKMPTENFPLLPWALAGLAATGIGFGAFLYRKLARSLRVNSFVFDLSFKHFFLDDLYTGFWRSHF